MFSYTSEPRFKKVKDTGHRGSGSIPNIKATKPSGNSSVIMKKDSISMQKVKDSGRIPSHKSLKRHKKIDLIDENSRSVNHSGERTGIYDCK